MPAGDAHRRDEPGDRRRVARGLASVWPGMSGILEAYHEVLENASRAARLLFRPVRYRYTR
jgi:hypothetical protein